MADITLCTEEIRALTQRIFESVSVPKEDAATVVEHLIEADCCGLASHGLMRAKAYIRRIQSGMMNPVPRMTHKQVADNMFMVDGDHGLGQVAMMYALDLCMKQAKKSGNAISTINNMGHIGMVSFYTRKAAQQGMLAFACTNVKANMAPYGGIDPMLGTNPFSVSFEAGKYDNFTLDMSTTVTSYGKIMMYEKEKKQIPLGWAVDEEGNDTTDPTAAMGGMMLPVGGYKGYGLAMIVEFLGGILAGGDLGYEAGSMFKSDHPSNTGGFLSVIDVSRFMSHEEFIDRVEPWLYRLKGSRVRPGFSKVRIPGEMSNRNLAAAEGKITLLDQTYQELLELAKELNR